MQLSPISLAITRLGGVRFSPAALFPSGVQGAWYDPSDASTLFEDTAGTTPSPTPGGGALSVVGLMLDKSQNGVGTNGSFRYNRATYTQTFGTSWTNTNTTITSTNNLAPDGTLTASLLTASGTAPYFYNSFSTSPSTTNVCSLHVKAGTASVFWLYFNSSAPDGTAYFDLSDLTTQAVAGSSQTPANLTISNLGNGWYRISASWNNSQPTFNWGFGFCDAKGSSNCTVGRTAQVWGFQVQSGTAPTAYQRIDANWYSTMAGNHAISYNTTTARPELSARVNLLTYSEQFDDAAWGKVGGMVQLVTITPNTTSAPNGTITADTLTETVDNVYHSTYSTNTVTAGLTVVGSVCIKKSSARYAQINYGGSAAGRWIQCVIDLDTGLITQSSAGAGGTLVSSPSSIDLGNGWYRVFLNGSVVTDTTTYFYIGTVTSATPSLNTFGLESRVGSTSNSIFIWGADLRPANIGTSVPAYQRIADQYTYDSSGFPRYLVFNGTASGMYTPANLDLSGTDKATVFAGVRKISDAAAGIVVENFDTTPGGVISLSASPSATAAYFFRSAGTADSSGATPTNYAAPISNVLTGIGEISTDTRKVRVNGVEVVNSATDQGTGNYANRPITIGFRSGGSLWLNGYIYSLLVVGSSLTAAQISSTESWINGKEGGVY